MLESNNPQLKEISSQEDPPSIEDFLVCFLGSNKRKFLDSLIGIRVLHHRCGKEDCHLVGYEGKIIETNPISDAFLYVRFEVSIIPWYHQGAYDTLVDVEYLTIVDIEQSPDFRESIS